jgi:hypothetical protein
MLRRLVLSLALLPCFAASARAYDLGVQVSGYVFFPNPNDHVSGRTEIITDGVATANGGRAFDLGQFGQGGALCVDYTGQLDWFCATASASIEIDRQLVATTTYIGTATSIRLKAQVHLDYRNATAYSAKIWARATLSIPVVCHGGVLPNGSSLTVSYRLDGEQSLSVSDSAVMVTAPPSFEDCTPGGVCTIKVPTFDCTETATLSFLTFDLFPRIQIDNVMGHQGWSVLGASDYSHTFELLGMDVLDDQGHPVPGARAVVPGDGGALNDVFLTSTEAAEVAANSTTTTTTIDATVTTTSGATTSTTAPSCATADLAAAECLCAQRPVAGCSGVTLAKPVDKGVSALCAKIAKATSASEKKRRKLAKQAVGLAKKALRVVNGKKGNAIPAACRDGLRGFLQATQADVATATH